MGVEYFSDLINKYAPDSYFEVPLADLSGTRIAIDLNNLVYAMYSAAIKDLFRYGPPDTKPDQRDLNYRCINYVLGKCETLLTYGITPICVVDGIPIAEKKRGQGYKKREDREKYKAALRMLEEEMYSKDLSSRTSEEVEKYTRYYKNYFSIDYSIYDMLREILSSCGFPILNAEDFKDQIKTADAEALCACLCINGICIATMSTDSDVHVYGGNLSILALNTKRSIVNKQPVTTHSVRIRSLEAILTQMDISFDLFQNACLLCGPDYNPKIRGIGYVKAYTLISGYKDIESLPLTEQQKDDIQVAKNIFCATYKELNIDHNSITSTQNCSILMYAKYSPYTYHNHADKLIYLVGLAYKNKHIIVPLVLVI